MKNDGGPAFPIQGMLLPNDQFAWPESGMSLRDRIAIAALPELQRHMFSRQNGSPGSSIVLDEIATLAYEQADAMLRAREAV